MGRAKVLSIATLVVTASLGALSFAADADITTTDLTQGVGCLDLANTLVAGPGITGVSNPTCTGDSRALGKFSGGGGIIGIEQGIILSSGKVPDVGGPNTKRPTSTTLFGL